MYVILVIYLSCCICVWTTRHVSDIFYYCSFYGRTYIRWTRYVSWHTFLHLTFLTIFLDLAGRTSVVHVMCLCCLTRVKTYFFVYDILLFFLVIFSICVDIRIAFFVLKALFPPLSCLTNTPLSSARLSFRFFPFTLLSSHLLPSHHVNLVLSSPPPPSLFLSSTLLPYALHWGQTYALPPLLR
jgi:hypothetical protein